MFYSFFFTHTLKNPIIKSHRKISKEPAVNFGASKSSRKDRIYELNAHECHHNGK